MNSVHHVAVVIQEYYMVKMPLKKQEFPVKNSVDINKLIERGAPVKQDLIDETKKWTCVNLRFPTSLLNDIDDMVNGLVGTSRTGWILQTLQKELKKMNSKGFPNSSKDDH